MNRHSGINDNNKKDRTKATAAIPMVGAIVTAALLLSGLSLIGSYQSAIAQVEDLTGGGGGTEGGTIGGGTEDGTEGGTIGGGTEDGTEGGTIDGGITAGGNATTAGGNATTAGGNATTGVNQTTLEVRSHLEEARTALVGGDTETALLHLDLALNTLGGNMTTTAGVVGEEVAIEEGEEGEGEGGEGEEGEEGEGEGGG